MKLWFVLRYFGWDGLASRLREHVRIAKAFADWVRVDPDFELLAPVEFGTVCFRARPRGIDDDASLDTLNEKLLTAVNKTRQAFLSHTKLGSRYTIRMVIGQLRTQEIHARSVWDLFRRELNQLLK